MDTLVRIPRTTGLLVAAALAAVSCGSTDQDGADATTAGDTTARSAVESTPPVDDVAVEVATTDGSGGERASTTAVPPTPTNDTTTTAPPNPVAPSTTASGDEPAATTESSTTMPTTADPCVKAADHAVGGAAVQYTFTLDGEDRAVGVRVGGDDALVGDSTVWVLLHGASMGWDMVLWMVDNFVGPMAGTPENQIVVSAMANGGPPEPAFWSQSESFNTDYLVTLMEHVGQSFCLDRANVGLVGLAQGGLAIAQGICEADLRADLVVMYAGLVKMAECTPARAIPIVSVDSYEFDPLLGFHWDGRWNGNSPVDAELTSGIEATPDDLAVWAELYNCTDGPIERAIPDEPDVLERDSIALTYDGCDAPLLAIGMTDAVFETDPAIVGPVDEIVGEFLRSVFVS